jgi:DNA end-binding protein Ku
VPRTIWKGALSFGLVNIPVGLYPATSDKSVHFNQFEEGTSDRIRYKKVNERTGEEVPQDRIVRGFDLGGGEYVILTDEELESAEPKKSRQIEISDFVPLTEIDPVFFRSSYYLSPEGAGADKAYALLRRAMVESGRIGIASMVMRNKEYLVAIRPEEDALALHTMYFSDEVRTPGRELPELPDTGDVTDRELSMAQLLIESMESEWDPGRFHDTHREKVEALVEEKRAGHEIVLQDDYEAPAKVVDLMEALNASIAAAARNGARDSLPASRERSAPVRASRASKTSAKPAGPKAKAAGKQATRRSAPAAKKAAKATKSSKVAKVGKEPVVAKTASTRRKAS